jgi:hypothetical protein
VSLQLVDGDRTFAAVAGDFVHVPAGIRQRRGEQPPPLGPDQLERCVEPAREINTDNLPDLT